VALLPDPPALRRIALAVAVLHDVDLEPCADGIVLRDGPPLEISWRELRRAVAGASLQSPTARLLALRHLRGRRAVADFSAAELGLRARPVGFPAGHPLHPGQGWVRTRVPGGALDLGLGFLGVAGGDDEVSVVPQSCLDRSGLDSDAWWPAACSYLERMGAVAAGRTRTRLGEPLRPIGDCDVVTLLGSAAFRAALADADGTGMAPAAVPMRRRGWLDLARIEPAFAAAAAAATDETDRGFPRPLLVTAEEVCLAATGGRPADVVLRDPAVPEPTFPDVRWR
jgi:hypothetical protein